MTRAGIYRNTVLQTSSRIRIVDTPDGNITYAYEINGVFPDNVSPYRSVDWDALIKHGIWVSDYPPELRVSEGL